jgi:Fic family protein
MRMPKRPPDIRNLIGEIQQDPTLFTQMVKATYLQPSSVKYPHWDQLVHLTPPEGLTHRQWWLTLKMQRASLRREIPLTGLEGQPFMYVLADPIPEALHKGDMSAGGHIEMPDQITNPDTRDRYYVASLIEEAITSSQLEGASTTRQAAKEMIRSGRKPGDRGEQMILNNYLAMKRMGQLRDRPLDTELVLDLHRQVSDGTLDDQEAVGRFRRSDERIVVADSLEGSVHHSPPPADELAHRVEAMCRFANGETPGEFIHPVLRSIVLHFWLAYDHPFVDGNGRTARALFYWSMLRHGYWLCEYISISHILRKAPVQYSRSFLYTETDDNDLTYFILYQLQVFDRAVEALHQYLKRQAGEVQRGEAGLKNLSGLNHRQRALIGHALRHPHQRYTIHEHQTSHNVVYQTARTDLLDLQNRSLLAAEKIRRRWYFTPVSDLEERLGRLT